MKILDLQIGPGMKCAFVVAALLAVVVAYFFPDTIWNLSNSAVILAMGISVGVLACILIAEYISRQNYPFMRFVQHGIIGCLLVGVAGGALFLACYFYVKAYKVTVNVMSGLSIDKYNTFIPGGTLGVVGFYLVALLSTICFLKHVMLPGCSGETKLVKVAISAVASWIFATVFVFISGTVIVETYSKTNPDFRRGQLEKQVKLQEGNLEEAKKKLEEFDASRVEK